MTNKNEIEYKNAVSPKGVFIWPYFDKANFKFKKEGTKGTKLRLSGKAAEKMIKLLQADYDEAVEEGKEAFKALPKAKKQGETGPKIWPLYTEVYDDNDEPTGEVDFNITTTATGVNDKGEKWEAKIAEFDAKGKPLPKGITAFTGSEGRISFQYNKYWIPGSLACGLSLKPKGVQITKLIRQGERSAESLGFGTEEDGFSIDDLVEEDVFGEQDNPDLEDQDTDF